VLSVAACGSSGGGTSPSSDAGNGGTDGGSTITIGAIMEETGPLASLGKPEVQAMQLAVEQVNASGGINGSKVKLLVKDSASDPATAAAAARSLVGKVQAVLGTATGASCRAVQPILDQAKILQYCQSPQDFEVTPLFFYGLAALSDYPAATTPWLRSLKVHKLGLIGQDDATGDATVGIFKEIVKQNPGEFSITTDQRFTSGATNVETQMTKIRDTNPDLIVASTSANNIVPVVKAMNALGMKQPVYVATGSATLTALDVVKGDIPAGGMYSNAFWVDVSSEIPSSVPYAEQAKKFVADYKAKYGTIATHTEGNAYDAAMQVLTAMKDGAKTGEEIAAYLESHSYTGVIGEYNWSKTRHQGATLPPVMMSFDASGQFKLGFSAPSE
jgi:branched-chain amino acid transport system substrate-binding protein